MPDTIERLESEISRIHDAMSKPEYYQQKGETLAAERARLEQLESDLAAAYSRWQELDV